MDFSDKNLKKLNMDSKGEVCNYLASYKGKLMDYSFTNIISLQRTGKIFYFKSGEDYIFLRQGNGIFDIIIPPLIDRGIDHFHRIFNTTSNLNENKIIKISNIDPEMINISQFEKDFKIIKDNPDYIYKKREIIEMSGNNFRMRRKDMNNLLKKFPDIRTEIISSENLIEIKSFVKNYFIRKNCCENRESSPFDFYMNDPYSCFYWDKYMTKRLISEYEDLDLFGITIKIWNKIAGILISEKIGNETLSLIAGKIKGNFEGGFTFMINELARTCPFDSEYLNLADDGNIDSLKNMKINLNPHTMAERYTIYEK